MGDWDGPGITALGLAAARALESSRPDRLVDDPLARRLYEAANVTLPIPLAWPAEGEPVSDTDALYLHGSRYHGVRARFFDDEIAAAVGDGIDQVVLLGAGLDTRAYRLGLPRAVHVIEVDDPGVLSYKNRVLDDLGAAPTCRRTTVGADLSGDWMGGLPLDAGGPVAWVAEGLLAYLPPAGRAALAERIGEGSGPGSRMAFDTIVGDPAAGGRLEALAQRSQLPMDDLIAAGEGPDLAAHLAAAGWEVTTRRPDDLARRYGRDLADPFGRTTEPPWMETLFVTALAGRRPEQGLDKVSSS